MNPVTTILPIVGDAAAQVISRLSSGPAFARVFQDDHQAEQRADIQPAISPAGGNPESLLQYEALLQNIHRMRDELHSRMLRALQRRGLPTDEPLAITEDTEGRLLESSGSWDRAEIERILEEDHALAQEFRELFRHVQTLRRLDVAGQGLPDDSEPSPVRLWMNEERAVIQTLS